MEWSRQWLEGFKGTVREGVSLASYSHMKVGGPAAVFLEPWSEEDAALAVRACLEHGLPWRVLGGGSNVLLPDGGLDLVVFFLVHWNRVVRDRGDLIVSAGKSLPSLLRLAKEQGLAGLETLAGIPAQVGGALAMNAGTKEGEAFDRLLTLRLIDEDGELRECPREEFSPAYRDGGIGHSLLTSATFRLDPTSPEEIQERMAGLLQRRSRTQPVSARSLGCIFKNPEGESAGRLIQEAGLKGERVGGIEVSPRHGNFFVNLGEGTAAQVLELVERVREGVLAHHGIRLELEIQAW